MQEKNKNAMTSDSARPAEQSPCNSLAENGQEAGAEKSVFEIDGIDFQAARAYCGSDALMLKMLGMFRDAVQKNADELDALFAAGDLTQYRIKVHSLKSSARTVGALELSQMALDMECAARDGNAEALNAGHPKLTALYRSFDQKLLVLADFNAAENSGADCPAALSEDEARKSVADLRVACGNFDLDALERIVGDLQTRLLPCDFSAAFGKIREFVKDVDFAGLSDFLDTL